MRSTTRRRLLRPVSRRDDTARAGLYQITVPGISVARDLRAIRRRLLGGFPAVADVLATTMPATVLIVYRGEDEIDAWLGAVSGAVAAPAPVSTTPPPATTSVL